MIVLGIETSCDDTGVAILKDGKHLLADLLASQVKLHSVFGGVVPELAARKHLDNLLPLLHEALQTAGITLEDVDCIGVTNRPGLVPSLLMGVTFAKGLAYAAEKPLVAVNHLEAHAFAVFLEKEVEFPFVALVVSGGHTSLFFVEDFGKMELLGATLDDAAGEAFDKVAKLLDLGYPGGPAIERAAEEGNPGAVRFPVAKVEGFNFSFSGVKTAVMTFLKRHPDFKREDVAASFQEAVVDALVSKTMAAAAFKGARRVVVAGGVACNRRLRERFAQEAERAGVEVFFPSPRLCTDNGAMVAFVATYLFRRGETASLELDVFSRA